MRIIGGFQDTRTNHEDFALTPFFFGVWTRNGKSRVRGIGICWGYYSVFFGFGFNLPKGWPTFKILK